MGVKEKAIALHGEGCNCAQSVLCSLEEYTNLPFETAKRVAEGFGGGVRCGEICGTVSSSVMAIGAATPNAGTDREAKMKVAELTKKIIAAYREKYGAVRCLDLKKAGVPCDELIAFGAEMAEKIITEERGEE